MTISCLVTSLASVNVTLLVTQITEKSALDLLILVAICVTSDPRASSVVGTLDMETAQGRSNARFPVYTSC